jgi:hypothetical protein
METLGGFPTLPAMVRADEGEGRRPEGGVGWEVGPESSAAPHASDYTGNTGRRRG